MPREPSAIEILFRQAAARTWPAEPRLREQYEITAAGRKVRTDFAVPELKLVIELESWQWHSGLGPEKVTKDKQRERLLEQAGWRVVSFTGAEVTADAARCVREALKIAGLSRPVPVLVPEVSRDTFPKGSGYWEHELDYRELLWQCRKLCLRALTLDQSSLVFEVDTPLILLDAFGFWDSYANRYDYTYCVQDLDFPDPDCEHRETRLACADDKGSIHFTGKPADPQVHHWHKCEACGLRFPRTGHEQEWLDCGSCGR